jgi:hypothetical protein
MTIGEVLSLKSCKSGRELFNKVEKILSDFNISVYDEDDMLKDLYAICCDVAEVLNVRK